MGKVLEFRGKALGVGARLSLALVVVSILVAGCTKKAVDSKLTVFRGFEKDDAKTLDPANAYDTVSLDIVPSIYETLYQYNYLSEEYKIEPLLASAMPSYSADGLTITIPIKKGVKFQDDPSFKETGGKGRELKAQDFVYAIKRLAYPSLDSQGWWVVDGKLVGINAFHEKLAKASKEDAPKIIKDDVEGVKALDDYTLQVKLLKKDPRFLYILAMSFTAPVPHEAVEAYADERGNLTDHPVGTGPFRLVKWERNHEIELERNPNFRVENFEGKPMPFVDRISMSVIKEAQPRWLNFMKGNMDYIVLPKDNFKQAMMDHKNLTPELAQKGVKLNVESGVVIRYISFNMRDKLLGGNKYLRQALSAAIDREAWINTFTNGTGKKMVNAVPPGILDRPLTQKIKYDYNLALAKDLLKKAGYPDGQGLPSLKFDLRGASTTDRQLGDFFAQQFSQIGVKVDVTPNTFPAYLEKQKQGALQIAFGGWSMDYPDAENIYQLLYGPNQSPGPAESNYNNPTLNKLYERMSVMSPGKERAQLIQSMDDILQEDCPWAMGYYETSYDLTQPWLKNFRGNEIIANKYKYLRVSQDIKKQAVQ